MMLDRKSKIIELIGAASCIGAQDHRCETAPLIVHSKGLIDQFQKRGFQTQWKQFVQTYLSETDPQRLSRISAFCRDLAAHCHQVVKLGKRFAVIGGDHSCAIGTWSGVYQALAEKGTIGMVWLDAHMDSHTHQTSHSGAVHGMPLAALLGFGDPLLTGVAGDGPKLKASNVALIGVRSFEPEEKALLTGLGVRIYYMDEVQQRGMARVFDEAVNIARDGTVGFGVSVDLDAIDPNDAPGVGSPEPQGLGARNVINALHSLNRYDDFLGIEVVELNPARDQNDQTAELALAMLLAAFNEEKSA